MSIVLFAETDPTFKTNLDVAQGLLTILGVLIGGSYFFYRVFYQRMFQRLSAELKLTTRVDGVQTYLCVTCVVTNKAEARINLDRMRYSLFWLDAAGNRTQFVVAAFPHNLFAEGLNQEHQEGPGEPKLAVSGPTPTNPQDLRNRSARDSKIAKPKQSWPNATYSVDADSAATFEAMVPIDAKGMCVAQVEFSPKLVPDRYIVEAHCLVN